jgi:hypothetical protein
MKKNCGTCVHRINGTDTHMVCGIRDYICRVNSNDSCSKHKFIEHTKTINAWIMTDNKDYFHVWIKKPPNGFTNTYKRIPCTITYKVK